MAAIKKKRLNLEDALIDASTKSYNPDSDEDSFDDGDAELNGDPLRDYREIVMEDTNNEPSYNPDDDSDAEDI